MEKTKVELFKIAYKKLKSSIYFDKTQLILRNQIVDFEAEFNDEDKWKILSDKILKSISVVSMPKKMRKDLLLIQFLRNLK